jgi:hypothetical protein
MTNRAPHGTKRQTVLNRQAAIEEKLEEMALWYVSNAPIAKDPPVIVEDRKTYRGKVLRWLEPPIPNMTNPVLIEEFLGDFWTLRLEPLTKT